MVLFRRLFVLLLLLATPVLAQESEDYEHLIRAKTELQKWGQSFATMRVKSRSSSRQETNHNVQEIGVQIATTEFDWVWEDSGRFLDSNIVRYNGKIVERSTRLADLRRYYTAGYLADSPQNEIASSVGILQNDLEFTSTNGLNQPFWGLWDDNTRTWLSSRIQSVERAKLTGEGLLEVAGKEIGLLDGYVVHLDPEHGYLPISVEFGKNKSLQYSVLEFQEVQPGFWFPLHGTILDKFPERNLREWEILDIELNTEFPDTLFVPPWGHGTRVVNAVTGERYWYGGKAPAKRIVSDTSETMAPPTQHQSLTASPEKQTNISFWLVLLGATSIAGAVWLRK